MKYLLLIALMITCQSSFGLIDRKGNGGDSVVQEFIALGKQTVQLLPYLRTDVLSDSQKLDLEKVITSATIESKDQLLLGSTEVDAINYPLENHIEISRTRWQTTRPDLRNAQWALSIHEYLWLANIDDTNYKVSNPLFIDLLAAQTRWRKSPIAQALTQAVCNGLFGRDVVTIARAMQMGADLEIPCQTGSITFECKDGHSEHITQVASEYPIERLMDMFGRNYCGEPNYFDPKIDSEMIDILKLLLSFKPDLSKRMYGPLNYSSILTLAARRGILPYKTVLSNGPNLNFNFDFGGLLVSYPLPSLEHFKLAAAAGADINLYTPVYKYILAANILQGPEDTMKFFVENHKINFCAKSRDPRFDEQTEIPLIKLAKPEYRAFIQSIGDPCTRP